MNNNEALTATATATFIETHSAPSAGENAVIRDLLRIHSAQTVRSWSDDYEILWLKKDEGPRAAAWTIFRVAYDDGLLSEWLHAVAR